MPRLALPLALAAAIVICVLAITVLSSAGNPARGPPPHRNPVFKRQDPLLSTVASLSSNLPAVARPSSSEPAIEPTTTTTTTTTSSTQATSTSSSVPSITGTRFDALTTSTSKSTTTTIAAALATTVATASTSNPPPPNTATSSTAQTTVNASSNLMVYSRTDVTFSPTASFVPTYNPSVTSVENSQTTSGGSNVSDSSGKGFMENKGAVGATFTVVGLVGVGLVIFAVLFIRKRTQDRDLNKADWDDSASMTEFASASANTRGGTGNPVVLPSAALAALARQASSRGHGSDSEQDRPDSVLAMPPVMYYERAPASAYDIVPAAPPQLRIPGSHNSFGSMMGVDPFAGSSTTPWQDTERDMAHGPGQAGRGAGVNALGGGNSGGYNMQPYAVAAVGGDENAYRGGPYGGGQQATGYQYAYPSHAYGQQYTNNSQQAGYGY